VAESSPATTPDELALAASVAVFQERIERCLSGIAETAPMLPAFRLQLKALQRVEPDWAARAEAVLAMCDIIDLAAAKLAALGALMVQHGLVDAP
jgi:hypothetical protein